MSRTDPRPRHILPLIASFVVGLAASSSGAAVVDQSTAATLKVSVKYSGKKKRNKKLKMGADQVCELSHEKKARKRSSSVTTTRPWRTSSSG